MARYIDEVKEIHPKGVLEVKMTGVELFYDGLPGHIIVFDNENEIGHAIRKTTSRRSDDPKHPNYEICTFTYAQLQSVRSFVTEDELEPLLDKLISKDLIPSSAKEDLLNDLKADKYNN